jgi:hypothetical protein
MSSSPNHPETPGEFDMPGPLAAEIQAAYRRDVSVPPSLDAAILSEAKAGFARRRRFRLVLRGAAVAAAAAVVVMAVQLKHAPSSPSPIAIVAPASPQQPAPIAPGEDVDRNGKVDILDAFVVAKLIEVQGELVRKYDVNGDGKVDQADVDRIAVVAVDTSHAARGRVQ